MTVTEEQPDTDEHGDHADAHDDHDHGDGIYWIVALFLGIITAAEVTTYAPGEDLWPADLIVPSLLVMMVVKFIAVTWFFMHLKFDWAKGHRMLTYVFYAGLILAVVVYIAALATFRYFGTVL